MRRTKGQIVGAVHNLHGMTYRCWRAIYPMPFLHCKSNYPLSVWLGVSLLYTNTAAMDKCKWHLEICECSSVQVDYIRTNWTRSSGTRSPSLQQRTWGDHLLSDSFVLWASKHYLMQLTTKWEWTLRNPPHTPRMIKHCPPLVKNTENELIPFMCNSIRTFLRPSFNATDHICKNTFAQTLIKNIWQTLALNIFYWSHLCHCLLRKNASWFVHWPLSSVQTERSLRLTRFRRKKYFSVIYWIDLMNKRQLACSFAFL